MGEHKAPEWVGRAVQLYEAGYSLSQVAVQVGKSRGAVRYQLQRAGVKLRSCKEGLRFRYGTSNWINKAERLYQEGYSLNQVSAVVGRSHGTVRYHLQHAEVELRSRVGGIRLRKQGSRGLLDLHWEPSATTLSLIGYGVGDGHLGKNGRFVSYAMKPTIVRDYVVTLLESLGLHPCNAQHSCGVWEVRAFDVRWVKFNEPFFTDCQYLRKYALKYPGSFAYGFFAAEGTHYIGYNGSVRVSLSNTNAQLLELTAECLYILGYETTLDPLKSDGARELRLRGSSLVKAKFAINSPFPNKRIPSNYSVRRSLLKPELQAIYDRALQELYAKYGKERVDKELLPAKRTGKPLKSHNKRTAIPI